MTTLILIRHAPTQPDPAIASYQWQLTDASKVLCQELASQIKNSGITKIYTSHEPKAKATGTYIASALNNVAVDVADNLHETERHSKQFYDSQDDFRQAVVSAIQSPDEMLFGDETFNDARLRLSQAIITMAQKHPDETIGIVSHGRILAMYLGQMMQQSPVIIWEKLKMPAYAVLSWETQTIDRIVYQIGDAT